MKTSLVFALAMLLVVGGGCSDREEQLEQQNTSLQNTNIQLTRDIASRDEYVDKITDAINTVYTSMEEIKAKESSLLKETSSLESAKKLTREEMRSKMIDRIEMIRATLHDNHERLADLQKRLSSSKKQYAGLKKMVDNLQKTLEERDQSIASLNTRVQGLERDVTEKSMKITQQESTISDQHRQITTVYYIAGTRDELEQKGIITKEGGFLWGLLGSTSTLANGFDDSNFKPLNKTLAQSIEVNGKIDEIIPKRNETFYSKSELTGDQSMLTIAEPTRFWQDKYLVIVTDRPNSN